VTVMVVARIERKPNNCGLEMNFRKSALWSKRAQISKTSQGLASQIGTPLRQGVRRPHLILARWLPKIRQAMRTFPLSGRSILALMLVKWL